MDAELTLDKAVTAARQSKAVKKQQAVVRGEEHSSVDAIRTRIAQKGGKGGAKQNKRPPYQGHRSMLPYKSCTRCGRSPPHGCHHVSSPRCNLS